MKLRARIISLILAVLLCLSMLPVGAWAEEIELTPDENMYAAENLLEMELPMEEVLPEEEVTEEEETIPEVEIPEEAESLLSEEKPEEEEVSAQEEAVVEEVALDGETVASGTCGDNLTWTLDDAGLLTISGTGDMDDWDSETVPWYDYKTVIQEVFVSDGITSIGNLAFYYCTSLSSISIPKSVISIGYSAFSRCSSLTNVFYPGLPEQWYSICFESGNDTLINAAGFEVPASGTCGDNLVWTLVDGTLTISGAGAMQNWVGYDRPVWYYCRDKITAIVIGEGVTTIGSCAFYYYTALTSVTLPDSITSIGENAFYRCTALTSITIPESVISIDKCAFQRCTGLTSVTLSAGVTSIGENAFCDCAGLTNITIPKSVQSIGYRAFFNCSSLISASYAGSADDWHTISIGSGNDELLSAITLGGLCGNDLTWTLKNGRLTISGTGDMYDWESSSAVSWYGCKELIEEVVVENGVTSIGDFAFSDFYGGYSKLTGITLPESVISVGESAFGYCDSLTSVVIPESVTSIGSHAFYMCSGLTSITLPESLTSIGSNVFYGCSKLSSAGPVGGGYSIEFGWSDSIPARAFSDCNKLTSITLPESVTSIGEYAFSGCSGLTSITLPEGVASIGKYALGWCKGLTCIVIPEGVTSVGDNAFWYCTALTSVMIPMSVVSIGYSAFYGCSALTSVSYPGTAEEWYSISFGSGNDPLINAAGFEVPTFGVCGDNLTWSLEDGTLTISGTGAMTDWERSHPSWYYSRDEITSVVVENGVTSIGSNAFYGCSVMSAVMIPDSVTSMGNYAFSGCSSLASINIPGSVETIPNSAFSSCTSLTKVVINEGPTSIGNSAFSCCTLLTSVAIPGTVTEIGATAFGGCTSLKSIVIPEGVKTLGAMDWEGPESEAGVFADCSALTKITLPVSLKMIGIACFHNTSKLATVVYNGEEDDWKRIYIAYFNEYLLGAVDYPVAGPCGADIIWEISGDTLVISGTGAMEEFTATSNPWRNYATTIKNIVIEEGVTSISASAFTSLVEATSTTIPLSVVSIGEGAYGGSMEEGGGEGAPITTVSYAGTFDDWMAIDIGDSNYYLWNAMGIGFGSCGTDTSWFYHDGTLTISGTGAMKDYDSEACSPWQKYAPSITEIIVEEGVTRIGAWAFSAKAISETGEEIYHRVETVYLPSTLISVGNGAFCDCLWLEQIILADGTVIQYIVGDANLSGGTDAEDAQETLNAISGKTTTNVTENVTEAAVVQQVSDVNGDGEVDARDATQILRYTNDLGSVLG